MEQNPDLTLGVEFFVKAVENPRLSREKGRAVYEDREYVRIAFPGDRKREHVAPANEMHYVSHARRQMTYAERFAGAYQAFKDNSADFVHGTPLAAVGFLTPSERETLEQDKIRTVEQLAGLADRAIAKLGPGWREKVNSAQDFLKRAEGSAEVEALKGQIAELKAMMSAKDAEKEPGEVPVDPFDGFDREDLFNMAVDAGLEPRQNASRDSLAKMLSEAAAKKAKEAA